MNETKVTIGIMVVFAMLLALSIFFLDIIYVLVDPRVRVGGYGQSVKPTTLEKWYIPFLNTLERYEQSLNLLLHRRSSKPGKVRLRGSYRPFILSPDHQSILQAAPLQSSHRADTGGTAPRAFCPYLKLENDRGSVLQVASNRCRCTVNGRLERIGSQYQAEICRTNRYRRCPRLGFADASKQKGAQEAASPGQGKSPVKPARELYPALREFMRYPAAVAGVVIIIALIGVSIYTMIAIPYKDAIYQWNADPSKSRYMIPKTALPEWVNYFRKDPLPPTIILNSKDGSATKVFSTTNAGSIEETITYTIEYPYSTFPQDMIISFNPHYVKKPFVTMTWITPDGREFDLGNFSVVSSQRYVVSQELPGKYLEDKTTQEQNFFLTGMGGPRIVQILFKDPAVKGSPVAVKGTYTLRLDVVLFEPGSSLDAEMVLYGQVYGLAGTDHLRRDLKVPLLWGTPVALAFGLFGALTTGILSMVIAAIGVWFGGWVDSLIQRITEINMILPTLPIAITIYFLYSKSIWMILGVIIILSIFGSVIKTYRAAFLQAKELPYIEAAQAYGASNWRVIRHYLVPRIIPLLIPQLVILIPSYVFFEATLAYLNISDPTLPTWGKVVFDALSQGAYQGKYYWVLEPITLIILTALAFAVVGFALDSILNPRLRRI